MTNTILGLTSIWSRSWQRLKDITEAMDYDHAQYTADRMAWLQAELVDVKARVAQLETDHNKTVSESEEVVRHEY